ncbi:MAG: FAD-binding protein [Firmicutes bacterium]|jgi:glycolate oxidase|nr:FAD-binding protein [Bacillota bacterium]
MAYARITSADLARLQEICGAEWVLWGEAISSDFYHDELSLEGHPPEVVVRPQTTEQVAEILAYCWERSIPVTPRGAGTGLCGGAVAIYGGVLLVTDRMDRILEIDQENLMAVVEPGVLLMDFQKAVEDVGLFYPPDPGEKTATIGGNVSTNAGGMRAVKYGVTRDWVLGLEAVLPNGQIITCGGKVVKNSSGYSLTDLLIGSEGTLAVITKIIVKLLPLPRRQISLLVPFDGLQEAVAAVPKILSSGEIPAAVEFFQQEIIHAAEKYLGRSFPHSTAPAYLLLTFLGNNLAELERAYTEVAEVCLAQGAIDVFIANTADRQEGLWECRGAFLEAIKGMGELDEVDVVVPPNRIAELVEFAESLAQEYKLPIVSFGHAGDGNLHIYMLRGERSREEWLALTEQAMERIYTEAKRLSGQVSGEHGIGLAKRRYLADSLGPEQLRLLQSIKAAFDPKNLLNPGKIISV